MRMLIDLDMSKGELRRRSGISSVSLAMDEIQKYHDTENLKCVAYMKKIRMGIVIALNQSKNFLGKFRMVIL